MQARKRENWHFGLVDEFGEGLARRRRGLILQLTGEKVDWKMLGEGGSTCPG